MDDDDAPVHLHDCRVLLVDDDEVIRAVYAEVLRRHGCEVAVAADGAECPGAARELRPTVVLMDLRMPGTDGWEALRLLRSDPETAPIPVVALTGDPSEATRRRALEAGFDAFVEKAFTPDTLIRALEGALRDARPRRGGGGPGGGGGAGMAMAAAALKAALLPLWPG